MKIEKFNAILASALNVHFSEIKSCANQESATPGNLHRFALSRGDKYFLLSQYREQLFIFSPFSMEDIDTAIELSLH